MENFIEFKNVRKTYTMGEVQIHALDGVSFSISKGEFVIICGESGAGKSTILNLLGGMDTVSDGQIFVDGKEVSKYSEKEMTLYRRYDVGFVFQFYNLVQNLTLRENVELACQICKDALDIDETIASVGLSERSQNFPSQLSGGEQQRVAIARALAKNPKLLLCDEPTGALDYQTGKQVLKVLQDACKKQNKTVIVITHNLALCPMGDKVIKVKSGHIDSITLNDNPMDVDRIEY
ncbi:ABC transporter ATP-binding protein [Floccifex sp.]|uniref:ABC transporter ATP-binding protein n=1 Tax=Floccifex sp. TaxID=2815810 RepID=UPI002A756D8B|nr:ABC transporter ATP-binding protein [Floccifex sp.]MDD7280649.1 ABC transporter ATP-binding protein [Erysipelotrichaceae bacterium]MDY2958022.1 ABC transporter ATP-binding protein [Floccifex sp.]